MATLDLGKIKQVWRGTYNNGTAYVVDDLVAYTDSGILSTYICVANSTGNAPSSSGTAHASWNYVSKGVADPIPSQSGQSGKFLKTNGSALSFDDAGGGKILQVVQGLHTTNFSSSSGSFVDVTNFNATITPQTNSKILVFVKVHTLMNGDANGGEGYGIRIKRTPSGGSEATVHDDGNGYHDYTQDSGSNSGAHDRRSSIWHILDSSPGGDGSTAIEYKIQAAFHANNSVSISGEGFKSCLTLIEIGA